MSDAVLIALISTMGVTFLTGLFALLNQRAAVKNTSKTKEATEETKQVAVESRQENKDGFINIDSRLDNILTILSELRHTDGVVLRERLRFMLTQYQDKEKISYTDKESLDDMYEIYRASGGNGTIKGMYESACTRLRVGE